MAEHLKKRFKDNLDDIKDRMKEKRNQKRRKLGKTSQISTVKCKIATNSSAQLRSVQANNRALAQALQEEKVKLRDAQATILHLMKKYQDLKVQMVDLQRNLGLKQEQERVENRLSALNEIISKVSLNLLNSIDLLGPAKNLCSTSCNEVIHCHKMYCYSLRTTFSVFSRGPLQCADGDDHVFPSGMEADSNRNELSHSVSEICEESDNATSLIKTVPDKGQTSDFNLDNIGFGNVFPKSVSMRCRYSKMRNDNELCISVLDHSEAPDSPEEPSKQDEVRLEESLEKCTEENTDISHVNENKVGSELVLRQIDSETAQFDLINKSDLKQPKCESREDSQIRQAKHQKGKLKRPKSTSRQRTPKKRRGKETSKEKLDFVGGSSDAYDFHFEECVHVTPFRQNKNDKDGDMDHKRDSPETNTTESSDTEEDSDDSLYEPYKKKSKKKKNSVDKEDASPVYVRPRSKRCLAQCVQKLHNGTESESNKSSDKSIRQPSMPPSRHLCDVTNTTSAFPSAENATIVPEEGAKSPKRKRSCTLTVTYKEPNLLKKLRRGDPFTDTHFLSSPIFKQQKDSEHRKKTVLSKYNEKFVGC
ncbi:SGO1 protein, partial [Urocolius indicus]|nr:SGO1 protein [Urocolius indicus]